MLGEEGNLHRTFQIGLIHTTINWDFQIAHFSYNCDKDISVSGVADNANLKIMYWNPFRKIR